MKPRTLEVWWNKQEITQIKRGVIYDGTNVP